MCGLQGARSHRAAGSSECLTPAPSGSSNSVFPQGGLGLEADSSPDWVLSPAEVAARSWAGPAAEHLQRRRSQHALPLWLQGSELRPSRGVLLYYPETLQVLSAHPEAAES